MRCRDADFAGGGIRKNAPSPEESAVTGSGDHYPAAQRFYLNILSISPGLPRSYEKTKKEKHIVNDLRFKHGIFYINILTIITGY
jgi:hypothetical protein